MDYKDVMEKVDIYEYVSQYVDLQKKGREYWGLSPFKDEKTPSFSVDVDKQRFYDYSSGAFGNIIDFVKKYHHVNFTKALEILIKYSGQNINVTDVVGNRNDLLKLIKRYSLKKSTKKDRSGRVFLPLSYMDRYTKNKEALNNWIKEGASLEVLESHHVKYNPIDDSLVFPLYDNNGRIVTIYSRTLCERVPKYISYQKYYGVDFLYWEYQNRDNIRSKNEVIVFEGAKSVMIAESFGYDNCVATLTNHLNDEQLNILISLGVEVIFAYDKGVNIREDKRIQMLKHFTKVNFIEDKWDLLKNKDAPIDHGKKVWDYLYEHKFTL